MMLSGYLIELVLVYLQYLVNAHLAPGDRYDGRVFGGSTHARTHALSLAWHGIPGRALLHYTTLHYAGVVVCGSQRGKATSHHGRRGRLPGHSCLAIGRWCLLEMAVALTPARSWQQRNSQGCWCFWKLHAVDAAKSKRHLRAGRSRSPIGSTAAPS